MLLIKNSRVIDPASGLDAGKDLLIGKDRILKIADTIFDASAGDVPDLVTIDAKGCVTAPGLIDTHSHFRDPGFTYKEDLHTGSLAAARGGYTSIIMMANTRPPIDTPAVLKDVLTRAQKEKIHLYSAANVSKGMQGKELSDFEALKEAGAVVFTDDGRPVMDSLLLRAALLKARDLDVPVSLHEENPQYIAENGINAGGIAAAQLGITGSDRMAEISMIQRDVQTAVETGSKLLIQHISTAEGVELVRQARRHSGRIMAEATPHHFSLTEKAVCTSGSLAKVNPPLRTEDDRMAVIEGLRDGTIRIIATDHAPHSAQEKAKVPITAAPSGMIGLETALSLAIRNLVEPGYLSLQEMLACLTIHPAEYYQLPGGRIEEGGPADLVIFDPVETWVVKEPFASRSGNSPFIGQTLPGVVHYTIAGGRVVYSRMPVYPNGDF